MYKLYIRKLGKRGRLGHESIEVSIPRQFLNSLNVKDGDYVILKLLEDSIIIEPLKNYLTERNNLSSNTLPEKKPAIIFPSEREEKEAQNWAQDKEET
ncbi:MAG: AbrB/MazE/SpoVT family DNA-binding domain-containing protein [Nitrososphaeria archaeon]